MELYDSPTRRWRACYLRLRQIEIYFLQALNIERGVVVAIACVLIWQASMTYYVIDNYFVIKKYFTVYKPTNLQKELERTG